MNLLDHLSPADRAEVLDKAARYYAQALAEQQLAATVYDGQSAIATRLKCSRATAGKLLAEQRLGYTRLGRKGYRTTETQIQTYLANA